MSSGLECDEDNVRVVIVWMVDGWMIDAPLWISPKRELRAAPKHGPFCHPESIQFRIKTKSKHALSYNNTSGVLYL